MARGAKARRLTSFDCHVLSNPFDLRSWGVHDSDYSWHVDSLPAAKKDTLSIAVVCTAHSGHMLPVLNICTELCKRGHGVKVYTAEYAKDEFEKLLGLIYQIHPDSHLLIWFAWFYCCREDAPRTSAWNNLLTSSHMIAHPHCHILNI